MPITQKYSESLLRAIVGSICKRSKDAVIRWSEAGGAWMIMNLDDRDQGRLIGRGGATFYALETMMWYAGLSHAQKPDPVRLPPKDKNPVAPPKSPFKPNPKWDRKALGKLVDVIGDACLKKKLPYVIEDQGDTEAIISIQMDKYLKTPMSDPDFDISLKTLIHSAAMADGASVTANILWK